MAGILDIGVLSFKEFFDIMFILLAIGAIFGTINAEVVIERFAFLVIWFITFTFALILRSRYSCSGH
jgi:hypothetical protein